MGKLVVFKLGEGSFEQGFPVVLQIGEDGDRPAVELACKLPPAPEMLQLYQTWQAAYRRLGLRSRLEAKVGMVTNVAKLDDCYNAAKLLSDRLNCWLNSEPFRPIREKLLEQLNPADTVRLIIQTEDNWLRRLPWHLWDLGDRYPKAEIALSAPVYQQVTQLAAPTTKVRILAILGNSAGINTQTDRVLLQQLPDAEITFLVEPQLPELSEQLWDQSWDILFFAGHSSSQANGKTGRIYINQTDSLTIEQLKYAVNKAVAGGLKIAIFNSCDGLGLARDLADLQIPQIVVMREPVPDRVAHEFLKYFLAAFARGETLYLAVREARERLQALEQQFPCASWLPVICQNLAEVPPTWQGLQHLVVSKSNTQNRLSLRSRCSFRAVLVVSGVVAALLVGVRQVGILQQVELQAFDQLTRWRPAEKPDPRLLVVKITEADLHLPEQQQKTGSLSDLALSRLLTKLEQYQPRAIGLDIYRDYPVSPKHAELATQLRQQHLITVCKASDPAANDTGIKPPPEVSPERLGFSDFVTDPDGVVRRQLLILTPDPASVCTTPYAFSVQLAFRYLAAEGIVPQYTPAGFLQLGKVSFPPLGSDTGGYQGVDAWGNQVLLNYRFHRSLEQIAAQVTLQDVLAGRIDPNAVKDRIVLIGTTASSFNDYWLTPYSQSQGIEEKLAGVFVQAQMVSQILSAVVDGRSLLSTWSESGEICWIWGWSLAGGILAWRVRSLLWLGLAMSSALLSLAGLCFFLLIYSSCWVPLVPPALALVVTSSVAAYRIQTHRQKYLSSQSNHESDRVTSLMP